MYVEYVELNMQGHSRLMLRNSGGGAYIYVELYMQGHSRLMLRNSGGDIGEGHGLYICRT